MSVHSQFRFFVSYSRNACRDQETHKIQTQIIRDRASQYSEPSSRRGSIGVSIVKKKEPRKKYSRSIYEQTAVTYNITIQ